MKAIKKLNKWANVRSQNYLYDILRWILGAFLFYKGVDFFIHSEYLAELIQQDSQNLFSMVAVHYVAFSHLAGGLFIILGLLTRLAALLQLPILIGAVVINAYVSPDSVELMLASLALMGTTFFVIAGSGKHSIDYTMKLQV